MTQWVASVMAVLVGGVSLSAQPATQPTSPSFEVASVIPNAGTATGWSYFAKGETFTVTNVALRRIIALAYGIPLQLEPFRIAGGTNTVLARRFDIQARIPAGVPADRLFSMLRSLLVERFRLRARFEVRQGPVYSLVVARSGVVGPELRPSQHNCNQYRAAWLENNTPASEIVRPRDARNRPLCLTRPDDERPLPGSAQFSDAGTIANLTESIQGFLDRPVLDATQLSGNFEWRLTFSPSRKTADIPEAPSISVALREQLGLQLEARTGPVEVLLIESVEMPTPN